MRAERTIRIDDRDVVVRELTVGEVRQWIAEGDRPAPTSEIVRVLFAMFDDPDEQQVLAGVERITDLKYEDLAAFTLSEVRDLLKECREVNDHFFGRLERVTTATRSESSSSERSP